MRKAVLSKPQGQKLRENLSNLINSLTPVKASELYNEFVRNTSSDSYLVPCAIFSSCKENISNLGMLFKLNVTDKEVTDGDVAHIETNGEFEGSEIKDVKEYVKTYFEHYALEWFYFAVNFRDKAVLSNDLAWDKIIHPILRDKINFHDRSKLEQKEGGTNGSSTE